jgi:hypothetical protein
MVLKLRPLTCVNFKCKTQLPFTHIKGCDTMQCFLGSLKSLGFKPCNDNG